MGDLVALDRSSSASTNRGSKLLRSVSQRLRRGFTKHRRSDCDNAGGCWNFRRSRTEEEIGLDEDDDSVSEEQQQQQQQQQIVLPDLPDDLIELLLARTSFPTLQRARAVCKRWRDISLTPYFLAERSSSPWLLVFGLSRDGVCIGQALDASNKEWHTLRAEPLAGRLLYTATAAPTGSKVFIVGGCSARVTAGGSGAATPKTHRSVLEFDIAAGRWRKTSRMRAARNAPLATAFFIADRRRIFVMAAAAAARRQSDGVEEEEPQAGQGLIVVGGLGQWNEPLSSGEIYDAARDAWLDIEDWPVELGTLCSGAVCGQFFFGYSESDKLAAYDFALGHWRRISLSYVPHRLHDNLPKLVECRGCIYLVGVTWTMQHQHQQQQHHHHHQGLTAERKIWKLLVDQAHGRWMEVSQHPDAPLDWNAVFVSHGSKIYGLEMFKMFGQMLEFVTVCEIASSSSSSSSCPPLQWDRVSKQRMGHKLDASSCFTKTAVLVQL